MEKKFETISDLKGNVIADATLRVLQYPSGLLATIYSDPNGIAQLPNPLTTDSSGYVEYYAADGRYSWVITTDTTTKTINDIIHDDTFADVPEQFLIPTGTGDAMVVAAFNGIYTLTDGDDLRVRAPGANTVSNPTITLPGVGALTIFKLGGQALDPELGGVPGTGSISGAGHELTLRYVAAGPRMELIGVL